MFLYGLHKKSDVSNETSCLCLQVRVRDADNDRLYSFELSEQLFSGSQVEAWKELPVKTLAQGGDEAERKPVEPLTGTLVIINDGKLG